MTDQDQADSKAHLHDGCVIQINLLNKNISRLKASAIDLAKILQRQEQEIASLKAENAARLELLHKAVNVIRDWHNMGMERGHNALKIWQIYWNNAPEMKDIQLEIDRVKGEKA
jgi:hypothetical protein